jgi:hypothetical protein
MRHTNVLLLSTTTASLALAVHLPRLRAGIPHHRDLIRRLDLEAPSHDDNVGFVQLRPTAGNGAATTLFATTTTSSSSATTDSAAQWLSFDPSGTSVLIADDVNLVATGGTVAGGTGSGTEGAQSNAQGAESITQQPPPPSSSPPSPQPGGLGPQSQEQVDRWIKAHNEARKAHGAGELKWREDLSWGAKTNAERCQEGHT